MLLILHRIKQPEICLSGVVLLQFGVVQILLIPHLGLLFLPILPMLVALLIPGSLGRLILLMIVLVLFLILFLLMMVVIRPFIVSTP